MKKVRIGVIGCGRISDLNVLGYLESDKAEVTAVCDISEERAREKAADWGAKHVYTDYRKLLRDAPVDAVEIVTPHSVHAEQAIAAAESGKHVSVQKPMAMNLTEADEMIAAADKAGVKFRVFECFVFYPPIVKARKLLDAGEIGEPSMIRLKNSNGKGGWDVPGEAWEWRFNTAQSGGGMLYDHGHHLFATALYLMGDVEKVSAFIWNRGHYGEMPAAIMWQHTEPARMGIMDVTLSLDMPIKSEYYADEERAEITGSKGIIWVTRGTGQVLDTAPVVLYKDGEMTCFDDIPAGWEEGFRDAALHFVDCILKDKPPVLSGKDAKKVLRFCLAAYKSADEDRPISLDTTTSDQ